MILLCALLAIVAEVRTSRLQSSVLSRYAARLTYDIGPGPSSRIGDRYFGVITASVEGPVAADYRFTSELPLAVLRLLAPLIEQRLAATGAGPT
jgi:hypothetical protein